MLKRNLLVLGLMFSLTGCLTDSMDTSMSSWIGHSRDDLVTRFGAPSSVTPMSDGGELIEFADVSTRKAYMGTEPVATAPKCARSTVTPQYAGSALGSYNVTTQYSQSGCGSGVEFNAPVTRRVYKTVTDTCTRRYRTNSAGIVTTWSYSGC